MPIVISRDDLARVYGTDGSLLAAQEARYGRALEEFARRCGSGEVRVYHAPGRVNLIGENTDYNRGYVMPSSAGPGRVAGRAAAD